MQEYKICENCGKEFIPKNNKSTCCCKKCSHEQAREKFRAKRMQNIVDNGVEGIDYIIDLWNGLPTIRVFGAWMKRHHPGKTIEDYKREFPGAPTHAKKDQEKYQRKRPQDCYMRSPEGRAYFSERFKGENNPRHRSKISEYEIRSNSPYCIEFYQKRYPDLSPEEQERMLIECKERAANAKIDHPECCVVKLEYWLAKGYSEEEAKRRLKEEVSRHKFTIEKCIKKYGEEEGRRIFEERQQKWKDTMYGNDSEIKLGRSRTANEFIDRVLLGEEYSDEYILYGKNEKMIYDMYDTRSYFLDLTNEQTKRVVEFNGDFWHCNPRKYDADYYHRIKKKTAKEIWEIDKDKMDSIKYRGYKVLVIWEDEYKKDEDEMIAKAKNFLFGK